MAISSTLVTPKTNMQIHVEYSEPVSILLLQYRRATIRYTVRNLVNVRGAFRGGQWRKLVPAAKLYTKQYFSIYIHKKVNTYTLHRMRKRKY